jgi:hypothetical protein
MPYISSNDRKKYEKITNEINACMEISTKGDLEFLVFCLMKNFMLTRPTKYTTLHDCVYAVQHASDEFRRRFLDKREDEARETNGDI